MRVSLAAFCRRSVLAGARMTPAYMRDELGQWIAYSFLAPYYLCGISRDKAEALSRWAADLKWVTR